MLSTPHGWAVHTVIFGSFSSAGTPISKPFDFCLCFSWKSVRSGNVNLPHTITLVGHKERKCFMLIQHATIDKFHTNDLTPASWTLWKGVVSLCNPNWPQCCPLPFSASRVLCKSLCLIHCSVGLTWSLLMSSCWKSHKKWKELSVPWEEQMGCYFSLHFRDRRVRKLSQVIQPEDLN